MRENSRLFADLLKKMKIIDARISLGIQKLASVLNHRTIEIIPDIIKYIHPQEEVFRLIWKRIGR